MGFEIFILFTVLCHILFCWIEVRFIFVAGMQEVTQDDILKKLDETPLPSSIKSVHGGVLVSTEDIDDYGKTNLHFCSIQLYLNRLC